MVRNYEAFMNHGGGGGGDGGGCFHAKWGFGLKFVIVDFLVEGLTWAR